MPFNINTGVYTPAAGAESATTGQVIQSAVWNTIFTDLSGALTSVGQGGVPYPLGLIGGFAHSISTASVADAATLVPLVPASMNWTPAALLIANAGTAGTITAAAGLFTGAAATGTTIIATSPFTVVSGGASVIGGITELVSREVILPGGSNLFFRITTVSAGGTVSVWLQGQVLP